MSDELVLTNEEVIEFQQVLQSAFNRGELKSLVFEACAPQTWELIVSDGGGLAQQLLELITWANNHQRAWKLLQTAQQPNHNSSNRALKAFDEKIRARLRQEAMGRSIPDAPWSPPLPPELRARLVTVLLALDVTHDAAGRTTLLSGINTDSLRRDHTMRRHDLEEIVDQLANRGRLSTGGWPLLHLIDNALPYGEGYQKTGQELSTLRAALFQLYEGG